MIDKLDTITLLPPTSEEIEKCARSVEDAVIAQFPAHWLLLAKEKNGEGHEVEIRLPVGALLALRAQADFAASRRKVLEAFGLALA